MGLWPSYKGGKGPRRDIQKLIKSGMEYPIKSGTAYEVYRPKPEHNIILRDGF